MTYDDIKLTIMTESESLGKYDNNGQNEIKVIADYGRLTMINDLAILTGAFCSERLMSDNSIGKVGIIYTKTGNEGHVVCIDKRGRSIEYSTHQRNGTIRPVIESDEIFEQLFSKRVKVIDKNTGAEYYEVEFGEYPQYAVSIELQKELDEMLEKEYVTKTGKYYTFDSNRYDAYDASFTPAKYPEYEYKGKKNIRIKANSDFDGLSFKLSNDNLYKDGDYVWLEVSPVVWLVDERSKKLISKYGLVSGIRFSADQNYFGVFDEAEMNKYFDNYMKHDLFETSLLKKNDDPYGFDYKNVSEEDIIEACIKSDIPIFLHGRSGDGKSARVMEIDPNCIKLSIAGSDPEKIVGKTVYSGRDEEMIYIKPVWLKKLYEICEAEPDKLHVVFLDEITNAVPSLQTMAFDIVLYKVVNGMWELPKNSRVVAAGNETEESIAAYGLSEPLFGRFAHVYIKTTAEIWLPWAIEHNIHPAIYAYIAYMKDKALRTEYNGLTPNADPRKWEMASNMLYATMRPEALRALIGDALTREFVAFCKNTVITIDDVLSGNYDENKVKELNPAKKYATVMTLSLVDDKNFMKVREFVKIIEPEYLAVFDSLWARKDEKRLELLAVINEHEKKRGVRR